MKNYRIVEVKHYNGDITYEIQERVLLCFWIDMYKYTDFMSIGDAENHLTKYVYSNKKRVVKYL